MAAHTDDQNKKEESTQQTKKRKKEEPLASKATTSIRLVLNCSDYSDNARQFTLAVPTSLVPKDIEKFEFDIRFEPEEPGECLNFVTILALIARNRVEHSYGSLWSKDSAVDKFLDACVANVPEICTEHEERFPTHNGLTLTTSWPELAPEWLAWPFAKTPETASASTK